MTAASKTTPTWPRRPWIFYAIAAALMIICWTVAHYRGQPYRSPTYRSSVLQCFAYAAWTTPLEGAGPAVIVSVIAFHLLPGESTFLWFGPLFGASIYTGLVIAMSRFGRSWSPAAHLAIGSSWLLLGAIVFTALTEK